MLTSCENELNSLNLKLNVAKSVCLRIGQRFDKPCCSLHSEMGSIPWVKEAKYLGVFIVAGRQYKCCLDKAKAKFYRSSNAILGKLGKQRNPWVALQLISSTTVPVLTYGMESMHLNKSQRLSIDHPWDRTFMKMFSTFDHKIVKDCQCYGGFLPISLTIDIGRIAFIKKLFLIDNNLLRFVGETFGSFELTETLNRYDIHSDKDTIDYRNAIHNYFRREIAI